MSSIYIYIYIYIYIDDYVFRFLKLNLYAEPLQL